MAAAVLALGVAVMGMDPKNSYIHTVYREHPANFSDMKDTNTGDEVGDTLFLLVNIDGAQAGAWTPSDEGNPAKAYVSQYVALFDGTYTGYSSCDDYGGKYECCCKTERQHDGTKCDQSAVGYANLTDYFYTCIVAGEQIKTCQMSAGDKQCPKTTAPTPAPGNPLLGMKRRHAATPESTASPSNSSTVAPCGWKDDNKCQVQYTPFDASTVHTR
jgi:hypothetical protein